MASLFKKSPLTTVFTLGFRPFFLSGSAWALLSVLVWVGFQTGTISPNFYWRPSLWHAHEMIFGFASAFVAGFILTAGPNWTGKPAYKGKPLLGLWSLWTAGRIVGLTTSEPYLLLSAVDLAFFPLLGAVMFPHFMTPGQLRNRFFLIAFGLLFLGNLMTHLETFGLFPGLNRSLGRAGVLLGTYTILALISLIAGRVIPFFSSRVLTNYRPWRHPAVDITATALLVVIGIEIALGLSNTWVIPTACGAAAIHFLRWSAWKPWLSVRRPILSVLFMGYLWLVIGLALTAAAPAMDWNPSSALHALTSGAIGVIIMGMITRVSLGHTGRPIQASPMVLLAYFLINVSVALRVFLPIFTPEYFHDAIVASGWAWTGAFALFLWVYTPVLIRPRLDGKPG